MMNIKSIFKIVIVKILTIEARLVLRKYKPKIVAVTGSVGKTSTKDAIYTALLPFFHVRKSDKSYNNELGIPLTILGLGNAWNDPKKWLGNIIAGASLVVNKSNYPEWLVLEVGADHPGEIEGVMRWVHPDVSVVTRIGDVPVHVEHYRSVKEVVREKSFLASGVKSDGLLVLNADDEDVIGFKELSSARVTTFGIEQEADIRATYIMPYYEDSKLMGTSFKVDSRGSSIPLTLRNVIGKGHVYSTLGAFAVVSGLGKSPLELQQAFDHYEYPRGRMNIIEGYKSSVVIDDTYNASPVAMEEAFRTIESLEPAGRKIAILGDMLDLGKYSLEAHQKLGGFAGRIFGKIVTVGIRARDMKDAAVKSGMNPDDIVCFDTSLEAGDYVRGIVEKGDVVFVKGSQGVRMERAVEKVIAHPERKARLLVRQEPEWLVR